MKKLPSPTYGEISALVRYDPDTGKLFWRERPIEMFHRAGIGRAWNKANANQEAFTSKNADGYRRSRVLKRTFEAHRICWLLTTGFWPAAEIDHVNGDRSDNRLVNLREATRAENLRNRAMLSSNTSGVTGVSWSGRRQRWIAVIGGRSNIEKLGSFRNLEDARQARLDAERRLGYSVRHGLPAPPADKGGA